MSKLNDRVCKRNQIKCVLDHVRLPDTSGLVVPCSLHCHVDPGSCGESDPLLVVNLVKFGILFLLLDLQNC